MIHYGKDVIGVRQPVLQNARILLIDDEEANLRLLMSLLERSGYVNVTATTDPRDVLDRFAEDQPDLIVLDLNMPGMDGFRVLECLARIVPVDTYLPVLTITGMTTPEARERALSLGAKDFVGKPFDATEVLLRIRNLLETRFLHLSLLRQRGLLEQERAMLELKVQERTQELEEAKLELANRLARAAEYRDDSTGRHTQRVGELASRIGEVMSLPAAEVELIRHAAPLHDVGKIGIPDSLLLKPGKLTEEEFAVMQTHTLIGADLLRSGGTPLMEMARTIAMSHHEKWNGSGYPHGLSGQEIPLCARVVAVADVYDALSHARPYRGAWGHEEALAFINGEAGAQFDPEVVAAFGSLFAEVRPLRAPPLPTLIVTDPLLPAL